MYTTSNKNVHQLHHMRTQKKTKQKGKTSHKNLFQSSSSSSSAVSCSLFDNDNGRTVVKIFHFDNLMDDLLNVVVEVLHVCRKEFLID